MEIKHAFRVAIIVFVTVFISHYSALAEKFWIPTSALLVMQTPTGLSLQHGLRRFLVIVFAVAMGSLFIIYVKQAAVIDIFLVLIFVVGCYLSSFRKNNYSALSLEFLAVLMLLISIIEPVMQDHLLYARVCDVTLGSAIGLGANLILFPARADFEFRQDVILLLQAFSEYLSAIKNVMLREPGADKKAYDKRVIVENLLLTKFPTWVHEQGFNIALRQGHRHFLIMIERIAQLLFSMHHAARHEFAESAREVFALPLDKAVAATQKMIGSIVVLLQLNKLSEKIIDIDENIQELESTFKDSADPSLELLEISMDYSSFTAFIYDFKDLRFTLLTLLEALRET